MSNDRLTKIQPRRSAVHKLLKVCLNILLFFLALDVVMSNFGSKKNILPSWTCFECPRVKRNIHDIYFGHNGCYLKSLTSNCHHLLWLKLGRQHSIPSWTTWWILLHQFLLAICVVPAFQIACIALIVLHST